MHEYTLIKRLLLSRPLQNLLAVIVMALSIAAAVNVLLLANGLHGAMVQASRPFPMLMGAKGSPNQLVLNTVFLKDQPIGNFSYDKVLELRRSPYVAQAVPLGYGDNYRGYRLVGTEQELLQLRGVEKSSGPWLELERGRGFENNYEAVIGAEVAAKTGLQLGDSFASVHGVVHNVAAKAHDQQKFTVVGILKPAHGPYDGSILVPLSSIWNMHGHADKVHEEVTAVVIVPKGYAQSMVLANGYSKSTDVQLIFPSKTVIELFSIMGDMEKLLNSFSMIIMALALLIVGSSLYWFITSSRRDQAIMRALGAGRGDIMHLYFKLGLTLVGVGCMVGVAVGHELFAGLSTLLQQHTGLYLTAGVPQAELQLILAVLFCGAVCSLVPAYLLLRKDVAQHL